MINKQYIQTVLDLKQHHEVEFITELPIEIKNEIDNMWKELHSEWRESHLELKRILDESKKVKK